jgi:hypothetical protein
MVTRHVKKKNAFCNHVAIWLLACASLLNLTPITENPCFLDKTFKLKKRKNLCKDPNPQFIIIFSF